MLQLTGIRWSSFVLLTMIPVMPATPMEPAPALEKCPSLELVESEDEPPLADSGNSDKPSTQDLLQARFSFVMFCLYSKKDIRWLIVSRRRVIGLVFNHIQPCSTIFDPFEGSPILIQFLSPFVESIPEGRGEVWRSARRWASFTDLSCRSWPRLITAWRIWKRSLYRKGGFRSLPQCPGQAL